MHAAKRAPFPAFRAGDGGVLDPRLGHARRAAINTADQDDNQLGPIAEVRHTHVPQFGRPGCRPHALVKFADQRR